MIMFLNSVSIGSLLFTVSLASFGAVANADNINTSGTACRSFFPSQALDIGYWEQAVLNLSSAPRTVICPVPRSSNLPNFAATFFVDGHSDAELTTHCFFYVHNEKGQLIAAQEFISPPLVQTGAWEKAVVFAPNLVTRWDYASLKCILPANQTVRILGIASAN
jgi:hypothetical protein